MKKTVKIIIIILIALFLGIKDIKAEVLPKIFLEGNISNMTDKKDERKIKLHYVSNDLEFEAYTKIKVQGNSSLAYKKKNYTIKLYKDNKYSDKKNIDLDENWGAQHKFYLKANWIDKTHSRNIVTSNIVASIQKKYNLFVDTPNYGQIDGFPVEVYINNEFLGLYTWNIPKDNWAFNMDNDNPNHIVMNADTRNEAVQFKEEATFQNWELEIGPETDETLTKFNRLVTFIKDSTNNEFKEQFHEYLDLDATLNYYIMLNFAKLADNTSKNLLLATYDGQIWYPVLYDLDTSWGTDWQGTSISDYKNELITFSDDSLLWIKFQKNFSNEIADRYFELRKDILTKSNILNKFNKFYNDIPLTTIRKEVNKWDNIPGYDFTQIESFLTTRIPLVDQAMYNLYDVIPQVSINYSTTKPTIGSVTVTITPNRNDIIITKNDKKSYDYVYTFTENGEYTFEYEDWYGNSLGTITITIDNILNKTLNIIFIVAVIIVIIVGMSISSKKQKQLSQEQNISKESKKESTSEQPKPKTKEKTKSATKSKSTTTKKNSSPSKETTTSSTNNSTRKKSSNKKNTNKKAIPSS